MADLSKLTPGTYTVDAAHSTVGFVARHLMITKVRGRFTAFSGTVEIAPNPRVYNLAYHRVYSDGYWTEPHSSPNRDFTRLMFNTNWGNESSTDVDDYMIELPQNALPPAAQP